MTDPMRRDGDVEVGASLEQGSHRVGAVRCQPEHGSFLDPATVPTDVDLVVLGDPTDPTGVPHPSALIRSLRPVAALVARTDARAAAEANERAPAIGRWRERLVAGRVVRGIHRVPSTAPFVLARLGSVRQSLRNAGIAVRRCQTFAGLDATWARIAVRLEASTDRLLPLS